MQAIEEVRERMVMGVAWMRQIAALALDAPPALAAELESIAALAHASESANLSALTKLIESRRLGLLAG